MIEGFVNANLEAVVAIPLQGPAGQTQEVDAVIDTGFNGYLTLPPTMVADLGCPWWVKPRRSWPMAQRPFSTCTA